MKHGSENIFQPTREGTTTNRPGVSAVDSCCDAPASAGDASYQEMIEHAQCLVMRVDWQGRITYLNPYTLAFLARERNSLLNASVVGLIVPDTPANQDGLRVVLSTLKDKPEIPADVEEETECGDGRRAWIKWTLQAMGDEILCIGNDITRRMQSERLTQVQRDIAARLSAAAEHNDALRIGLDAAVDIADMDGGAVYLLRQPMRTPELACWKGLSDEELQAVSFRDVPPSWESVLSGTSARYGEPLDFGIAAESGSAARIRSVALAPIRNKEDLAGAILLLSSTFGAVPACALEVVDAVASDLGDALARINTEAALKESDERCRNLFETTQDIVYTHDMDGRLTSLNKAGERITGYSLAEAYGTNVLDAIVPEQRAEIRAMIRSKASDAGFTVYDVDILTKEGRVLPLEVNSQVIAEDGRPIGVQGIARDITKRKRAEEALRESEEKYRSILDNIEEGYYEIDLKGNLTFFNDSLCRILGYSREELICRDTRAYYVDDEAYAKAVITFQEVLRTGIPRHEAGWIMVTKSGAPVNLAISISLMRDDEGKPVGFRGIARNVTDRIRAEEERRQLETRIQNAQKLESLGVLAGGIAHDFNNLLVGIMGNAGLALMRLPMDSPIRTNVERIEASAKRAADLTNQMLAYSGKGTFLVRPVDLSKLVEEISGLLQASVNKNAVLRFDFAPDLPLVLGDPGQIQQIIMNLVTNASDALGEKHGMIAVRTGSLNADMTYLLQTYFHDELSQGRYVYVEVSDTGCGMDEETKTRIFDPFFTTKFTGRGLGLAATLGIVRSHKGTIKVYSEIGHGTTIKALFPVAEAESAEAASNPSHGQAQAPALAAEFQVGSALKPSGAAEAIEKLSSDFSRFDRKGEGVVLIVDDEEMVRDIGRDVLESYGFEVLTAADGREGVELYRQHADRIAIAIIDLTMPIMNGEEAFQEIQTIAQGHRGPHAPEGHLPVILSSGYSEEEATTRFAGKRLAGFIQKPYPPNDLIKKIQEALEIARGTNQRSNN